MEQLYETVRCDAKKMGMKQLKRNDIELAGILGKGNFGSVERGTYHQRKYQSGKIARSIPVAVKILKTGDLQTAEVCDKIFGQFQFFWYQCSMFQQMHCVLWNLNIG